MGVVCHICDCMVTVACSTGSWAFYFLQVCTLVPTCETFGLAYLLERASIYSSLRLFMGNLSLLLFLYKVMLLRLCGWPTHLQRWWWILFSKPSTINKERLIKIRTELLCHSHKLLFKWCITYFISISSAQDWKHSVFWNTAFHTAVNLKIVNNITSATNQPPHPPRNDRL